MKQVFSLLCLRITLLVTMLLLLSNLKSVGQLTYTWNQTGAASWIEAGNWNPARTAPAIDDILIFDNSSNTTVTNVPSETIGKLSVTSNTTVNLQSGNALNFLTIDNGGAGIDFSVSNGSALNINGTIVLTILLSNGATGSINGNMTFSGGQHKLNAVDPGAINFNSPAVFTQDIGCMSNVFTNSGTSNVILFNTGATFVQNTGASPFGLAVPASKVVFNTGSLYKHQHSGFPGFSGRTYADFELNSSGYNQTNATGVNPLTINNLIITEGSINLNLTGGINIKGNIFVAINQSLIFNPAAAGTLTFNGTTPQSITNNGTLTFGVNEDVVVNNTAGLTLNSSVLLNKNLIFASGKITLGNNNLAINNSAPGAITGYDATKYVVVDGTGVLKRFIAAAANSYDFPIGNNLFYKPATISFTAAPSAAGSLSARFNTGFVFFPNPTLNEGGLKVNATSIQGTWFIDAGDGLTGGTYDGTFTGNGAPDVIDYLKLVLVKRPSSPANQDWTLEGTHVTTTGSNAAPILKRTGMTGFSEFGLGGELSIALPIKLNYLNGTKQNNNHTLTWKVTCTNNPSATMSLERSADKRNFTGITTIVADALRCQQPFSYNDNAPLAGINYYRLKITDANGKTTYSNAIAILNKDAGFEIVGLLPTVITSDALLNVTAAKKTKMQVLVTDITGRQVQKIAYNLIAGSNQFTINLGNLSAGTYQITGYTEDGKSRTIRFVKQ